MYEELAKIEMEIKSQEIYEEKRLNRFLDNFDKVLEELRESPLIKSEIKKILLITSYKEKADEAKKDLYKYFEVFTAKNENDIYLILDTQKVNAIVLDKLDSIQEQVDFMKALKIKDQYKYIPIILVNKEKDSVLKTAAMELGIDEILETDLTKYNLKWHIENIVNKKQNEIKMQQDLNKSNKEVEDVYDALVNDRIYKKAMPYQEAEEFIIGQSGTAFDPKMINIFKIVKNDFRKINDENKDII